MSDETKKTMEIGVLGILRPDANSFQVMADYGVRTCQLQNWNMNLLSNMDLAEKVHKDMQASGVRLAGYWAGYSGRIVWNSADGPLTCGLVPADMRAQRVIDLKRGADFAKAIGAPAIITHAGFLPENPRCREYVETLNALQDIAIYCEERGLGFWFETGQETPMTLLRTIEDLCLSNLGINLDTANLILYGRGNPVDALDVFGKYVRNLHMKDGVFPKSGYQLGSEVPLGQGRANFPAIIRKLYELNFTGELIIEREISGEQQAKDILAAKKYLEDLLVSCKPA